MIECIECKLHELQQTGDKLYKYENVVINCFQIWEIFNAMRERTQERNRINDAHITVTERIISSIYNAEGTFHKATQSWDIIVLNKFLHNMGKLYKCKNYSPSKI